MISDVPLGGFLSGGVDSSAVVALMAARAPGRVKTFSIGFTVKQYDELEYARLVAERYGTDHHEETVSPSIDDVFDTLVEHFDEPFGDASAIPTLYLARMTRRHVTVALSGDGADELFGGYRRYYFGALEEKLKRVFPSGFRRPFFSAAGRLYPKLDFLPRVFRAKTLLGNLALEIGDSYFNSVSIFRDTDLDRLLAPPLRKGYSPRASFRGRFAKYSHLPPLQQMQAVDLETYLPGDILVKIDRASMAHSLEARSPWLDYRIGEFSFRLPGALKIKGRVGKFAFKSAFEDLIPAPILHRPKMGFATPLAPWFRTRLRPVFESAVLAGGMEDFLLPGEVRRLWREHQSGVANHERKLWNLLLLAAWKRRYLDGNTSSLMEESAAMATPRF
jgi:asparagine synthase (glutamine-hydrolysing)